MPQQHANVLDTACENHNGNEKIAVQTQFWSMFSHKLNVNEPVGVRNPGPNKDGHSLAMADS